MKVSYSSNNSGGSWWLEHKDWLALEAAGWIVNWNKKDGGLFGNNNAHTNYPGYYDWLGSTARSAILECETPKEAIQSFEKHTGQTAMDEGCNCCGAPHSFSWKKGEKSEYVSGEEIESILYGEEASKTLKDALDQLFPLKP